MYNINFIASAHDKPNKQTYSNFLIPFAFFALLTNKNSHVEIIVENVNDFKKMFLKELIALEEFNKNFLIRAHRCKKNRHSMNTYRFFEIPTVKAQYTYIADIDIMFLETDIVDKYKTFWPKGLPYNNILRNKNSVQLTGVHMVKTKEYFTKEFILTQQKTYLEGSGNDEVVLGQMCQKVFGLPVFGTGRRPVYGIHFSPNRGKNKSLNLLTSKIYYDKYVSIKSKYPKLFEFKIFQNLTNQLKNEFIIREFIIN